MKKNKCQNKIQGSNINSRKIMKVAFILIGIILNFAFVISQESKIKVGVGISVNPIAVVTSPYSVEMLSGSFVDYTPLTTVPFSISIPMEIGNKYRIEPEMGAYSYYGRREYKNIWDSHIYHFKSLVVRFGVGLFYSEKVDSGTHIMVVLA